MTTHALIFYFNSGHRGYSTILFPFLSKLPGTIPCQAFSLASLDEEKAVISAIPDFLLISKEKPTGSLSFHGFLLVVMVQSKFNIEGHWEA